MDPTIVEPVCSLLHEYAAYLSRRTADAAVADDDGGASHADDIATHLRAGNCEPALLALRWLRKHHGCRHDLATVGSLVVGAALIPFTGGVSLAIALLPAFAAHRQEMQMRSTIEQHILRLQMYKLRHHVRAVGSYDSDSSD